MFAWTTSICHPDPCPHNILRALLASRVLKIALDLIVKNPYLEFSWNFSAFNFLHLRNYSSWGFITMKICLICWWCSSPWIFNQNLFLTYMSKITLRFWKSILLYTIMSRILIFFCIFPQGINGYKLANIAAFCPFWRGMIGFCDNS